MHLLKDVPVKRGVESLAYIVSFTMGQKEGICKIGGRRKKEGMAGFGSANGQV
ncbi:MAG: hypothetical protein ACW991_10490 [Candidatus Hodarchaeales archaeon]